MKISTARTMVIALCMFTAYVLFVLGGAQAQASKTVGQVAAGCDAANGDVLARNIRDMAKIHLPAGKDMATYELAYADKESGQPNALCVRTRPFKKGEFAEVHHVLFGNGTHRFSIVEHDLEKKRAYND